MDFFLQRSELRDLNALGALADRVTQRKVESKALRALGPGLQLKCFTAIEVLHQAWLGRKSIEQTVVELNTAGLDCLTDGGARGSQ